MKSFQSYIKKSFKTVCLFSTVLSVACGSGTSGSSSAGSTTFPEDLAVTSPFATSSSSTPGSLRMAVSGSSLAHEIFKAEITAILTGTTPGACNFDPDDFLQEDHDAFCYGPSIDYQGHPDAVGAEPDTGILPSGDLGIWSIMDDDALQGTGHACAAAQLNSRLEGSSQKTIAAIKGAASLICTRNLNGIPAPINGSRDMTVAMNNLMITLGMSSSVTFSSASLSHSDASGQDEYSYEYTIVYDDGSQVYDISVDMTHIPDATGDFNGRVYYMVNDTFSGGNCPTSNVTHNGSLLYERDAAASTFNVEMRTGMFCRDAASSSVFADGRDANGVVDPSDDYDAASNPDGWGNNFSIFTANYAIATQYGNFSYSWQAGPNDGNSRVFNVNISENADGNREGLAYFGYGTTVEDLADTTNDTVDTSTDGMIQGFICNWAGPGNDHSYGDFMQYQRVVLNETDFIFESSDADSNILYAPTNDCQYNSADDGAFAYDVDNDGNLGEENASTMADATTEELYEARDEDGDSIVSTEETLLDDGFVMPTRPANI